MSAIAQLVGQLELSSGVPLGVVQPPDLALQRRDAAVLTRLPPPPVEGGCDGGAFERQRDRLVNITVPVGLTGEEGESLAFTETIAELACLGETRLETR